MIGNLFAWSDAFIILVLIVLEGLLSADNAIVLAMMVLGLPKAQQKKALKYGLVGAFAFRIVATLAAVYLIHLDIVKLIGAAYLLYLPFKHFSNPAEGDNRREPPRAMPWLGMTAFWGTVVKVELTNLVFSIDSILAAVAMSTKTWVVLTGGILGIVAMRLVVGQVMTLVERYPAIVDGAFIIIAWVGVTLLVDFLHVEGWIPFFIPQWLKLSVIVLIFVVSFLYARRHPSARERTHKRDDLPRH
jgi:YkoY family integral membrane protein